MLDQLRRIIIAGKGGSLAVFFLLVKFEDLNCVLYFAKLCRYFKTLNYVKQNKILSVF